jgi:hypothetical protein
MLEWPENVVKKDFRRMPNHFLFISDNPCSQAQKLMGNNLKVLLAKISTLR